MASRRAPRDRYNGHYPVAVGVFLHPAVHDPTMWRISRVGTMGIAVLDGYSLVKLAAHVIRDFRTDRAYPFTAVPQLRFRFLGGLWSQLQRRKLQIQRHFGGPIAEAERRVIEDRVVLKLGDGVGLHPLPERGWELQSAQGKNPNVTWPQLTKLSVVVLRDIWTELNYPAQYLSNLRTPDELEAFAQSARSSPAKRAASG